MGNSSVKQAVPEDGECRFVTQRKLNFGGSPKFNHLWAAVSTGGCLWAAVLQSCSVLASHAEPSRYWYWYGERIAALG